VLNIPLSLNDLGSLWAIVFKKLLFPMFTFPCGYGVGVVPVYDDDDDPADCDKAILQTFNYLNN
jgi:hypothetical protein